MAWTAGQDSALTSPVLEVAAQILDIKARAIKGIIISSPVRVTSNNGQGIRVIQSS